MDSAAYLADFRGQSGPGLDLFVGAVLLAAAGLGVLLFVERPKHDPNVHSPRMAWLRAGLYFCAVLVFAWLAGVLPALLAQPLVTPEQLADPAWLGLTALCFGLFVWGYVIWWPRGTLTHGRSQHWLTSGLFGLAWGSCGALFLLSLYAILGSFGLPAWGAALAMLPVLSIYNMNYQSGWWDIHVSPPHNIRDWNAKKVLGAHNPFLIATLFYLVLFGNLAIFVFLYALALAASAIAMRFPPFWVPDGPPVSLETAIGE